jgi:hypothetical protein
MRREGWGDFGASGRRTSPLQRSILAALSGRAHTRADLERLLGVDRYRLTMMCGLAGLRDRGLVEVDASGRFYRPDAPPPAVGPQPPAGEAGLQGGRPPRGQAGPG